MTEFYLTKADGQFKKNGLKYEVGIIGEKGPVAIALVYTLTDAEKILSMYGGPSDTVHVEDMGKLMDEYEAELKKNAS